MNPSRFGIPEKSEKSVLDQFRSLRENRAPTRKMAEAMSVFEFEQEQIFGEVPPINWTKLAVAVGSSKMVQAALKRSAINPDDATEAINYGLKTGAQLPLLNKIGIAAVEAEYRVKHQQMLPTRLSDIAWVRGVEYPPTTSDLSFKLMSAIDRVNKGSAFRQTCRGIRVAKGKGREFSLDAVKSLRTNHGIISSVRTPGTTIQTSVLARH